MHVFFTRPFYQQHVMTLSALHSPIFMDGERFWYRLSENKKYPIAGMKNIRLYPIFSLPGLNCCNHIDSPKKLSKKKACPG